MLYHCVTTPDNAHHKFGLVDNLPVLEPSEHRRRLRTHGLAHELVFSTNEHRGRLLDDFNFIGPHCKKEVFLALLFGTNFGITQTVPLALSDIIMFIEI